MLPLEIHLTIRCHVLLQAVQMESVAALGEGRACLILLIYHIIQLQVLQDELVPLNVRVLVPGLASIDT